MTATAASSAVNPTEQAAAEPDWENDYPADPELMTDLEGDERGLRVAKERARRRLETLRDRP